MASTTPACTARPLKVGVSIPGSEGCLAGETPGWSDLLQMARTAESAGFDSLWIPDHLIFRPMADSTEPVGIWESFTLLSAVAAVTSRIELGTLVACTSFRNPALLAVGRPTSWPRPSERTPGRASRTSRSGSTR